MSVKNIESRIMEGEKRSCKKESGHARGHTRERGRSMRTGR